MSRKKHKVPEGTKCCVCKMKPYGFWKIIEQDGALFPICSKTCGAQGGFIEKPVRRYQVTRNEGYRPSAEGLAGAI